MNLVFLVIVFTLEVYVIGFKLQFKMDPAGYIILLTQLFVLILRLFLAKTNNEWQAWFQAAVFLSGYIVNEATLFFFVYEMKYVKLKTESTSLEKYKQGKRPIKFRKYFIIGIQLFL